MPVYLSKQLATTTHHESDFDECAMHLTALGSHRQLQPRARIESYKLAIIVWIDIDRCRPAQWPSSLQRLCDDFHTRPPRNRTSKWQKFTATIFSRSTTTSTSNSTARNMLLALEPGTFCGISAHIHTHKLLQNYHKIENGQPNDAI